MARTYTAKPGEVAAAWHLVDAEGQVLGRLASRLATILQGKHRPTYTPHVDTGDYVVVVNAAKIRLTGKKLQQKVYHRLSTRPGHLKTIPISSLMATRPDRVVREAVRRMLPRSKLARAMLRKLKVYSGPDHPHEAQNPQPLEV